MVPKTKDWVERLNPDSKLPKFNTGRILVPESQAVNESLEPTETLNTLESSKDSEAKYLYLPLPKTSSGCFTSSEVMPMDLSNPSPKERPGLGIMKHTKPETQDSSNKSVSGTVTVSETKQTTPSVPTEVKDTKQESKLNALTKLVQMLIDEKVNSNKKTQESNSKIQKTESSKLVDSSKISQDSKPKVQSTGSSKSLRPKLIQKPQLKCELCHYTNHSTDDCYRILYCMICKREDHKTSDHEMYIASLKKIRVACYTQNRSIIVKRHDKTPYEIFKKRIPDISYFYVFECLVFIHNHMDHLSKFDANVMMDTSLGYFLCSKLLEYFNTGRQQVEETYHVTFDESMEAIRFTNTSVDEIGIVMQICRALTFS
ncbi:hypothetical protein Tco_0603771 [Tanacetum coccineum]